MGVNYYIFSSNFVIPKVQNGVKFLLFLMHLIFLVVDVIHYIFHSTT